jgi:hypothetical protein
LGSSKLSGALLLITLSALEQLWHAAKHALPVLTITIPRSIRQDALLADTSVSSAGLHDTLKRRVAPGAVVGPQEEDPARIAFAAVRPREREEVLLGLRQLSGGMHTAVYHLLGVDLWRAPG